MADTKGWAIVLKIAVSIRHRFEKRGDHEAQYLLLDGVTAGSHGHQDGNAILEFSSKNRTWLVDMGYHQNGIDKAAAHNMITISRRDVNSGEESPVQFTPASRISVAIVLI